MRVWLFVGTLLAAASVQAAEPMPIFDAHLHYSHDAWEVVPPKEVIALLKKGGVLWIVANRHLPYEAELKDAFKRVEMIADSGGYKVFEAVK